MKKTLKKPQPKRSPNKKSQEELLFKLSSAFDTNTGIFLELFQQIVPKMNMLTCAVEDLYMKSFKKGIDWRAYFDEANKPEEDLKMHPEDAIIFGGDYKK